MPEVIYNIDKNLVREKAKKVKIIMFDLDGTLTKAASMWQYVHEELGVWEKAKTYKEWYFQGKIDYDEWARLDTGLWKGITYEEFMKIIDRIPFVDDLKETISELKKKGYMLIVITGGLDIIKDRLYEIGFDYVVGNTLVIKDGIITGDIIVKVRFDEKDGILENFARKHGYTLSNCAAVGDGLNDIRVFKKVELAISFNPESEEVAKSSHVVIKGDSIKPILEVL